MRYFLLLIILFYGCNNPEVPAEPAPFLEFTPMETLGFKILDKLQYYHNNKVFKSDCSECGIFANIDAIRNEISGSSVGRELKGISDLSLDKSEKNLLIELYSDGTKLGIDWNNLDGHY